MPNPLPLAAGLAALLLASCGPKTLALPDDPVDRAATCSVVAAADARLVTDVRQVLPFEAQGRIVHYPLLAGSTGETFSAEAATKASARTADLESNITEGKWKDLIPQCRTAFPATAKTDIELPDDRYRAQLGCNELADFMLLALTQQAEHYGNELSAYLALKRKLEQPIVPGLRAAAGTDLEAQKVERGKALSAFAKLGPPVEVLKICIDRYGE